MAKTNAKTNATYTIKRNYGVLRTTEAGWKKELNFVEWTDDEGTKRNMFDIRDWNPTHTRMSKGITLNGAEACKLTLALFDAYSDMFGLDSPNEVINFVKDLDARHSFNLNNITV